MGADRLGVVSLKGCGLFEGGRVVDLLIAQPASQVGVGTSLTELILEDTPGSATQLGLFRVGSLRGGWH